METPLAPEPSLFRDMQHRAAGMSRNHARLARHITDHYQTVAFSTISELAAASGVSEATIVRFCRMLDFAGYPALQKEIRRLVRADLKGPDRFQLASLPTAGTKLDDIIAKELENIEALQRLYDAAACRKAVQAIRKARALLVVGSRSTASLANHVWFGLAKLGLPAERALAISSDTYDHVGRLDRQSLLLLIGYPRYPREQIDLLAFAKRRGVPTLVLTDSPFSALQGDISLYAPAESASFTAFHCAPLILINALLRDLSLLDRDATLAALDRFEALAEDLGYFDRTKGQRHG